MWNPSQPKTATTQTGSALPRVAVRGWNHSRWRWALGALLASLIVAFTIGPIKRRLFPVYWSADDLGPIAINERKPPEPPPEGMVWIAGGTYWMGSEHFKDTKPVHKV